MKKMIVMATLMVAAVTVMMAGNVTTEQAEQLARQFLNQHRPAASPQGMRMAARRPLPVSVATDDAAYYVFNVGSDQGFVIVSGDDVTEPILGYSDQGSFDPQDLPANMQWWLDSYASQIAAARQQQPVSAASEPHRVPTHAAIEPLLQTTWNQGNPYNQLCPIFNDSTTYTGCVATAMAQIIGYYRYPAQVPDMPAYTYQDERDADVTRDIEAIEGGTIDWDNILPNYPKNTDATILQQMAIAKLMRWVGQSVHMSYGTKASGAYDLKVPPALINDFGYDKGVCLARRSNYSAEKWDELIYNELAAGRPVYYSGSATGGGHAFVCDGYDGNGLFHINWGWGGSKDGFFRLSVLDPYGGGIGAADTEDGYAIDQQAIIGIQPPTTGTTPHAGIEISDFYLERETMVTAVYVNQYTGNQTIDYGFQLLDADKKVLDKTTMSAEIGYLQTVSAGVDVTDMKLADGTYYLYPYYALKGQEPLDYDPNKYADIVVSGGKYKVTIHPLDQLTLNFMTLEGEAVADSTIVLKVSVTNTGDECNGMFYLFAAQGDAAPTSVTRTNVVIETGATEETSFYFKLSTAGTWSLWLALDEDGKNVLGDTIDITVSSTPTAVSGLTTDREQPADVYTIDGRHIGNLTPTQLSRQPKGVYIVGGRKVIVHSL